MERELSSAMRLRVDSSCFTLFSKVLDRDSRVGKGIAGGSLYELSDAKLGSTG
jgi:hypothetical protein